MQATGIGKLKPNIILMGYKTDWQTCDHKELDQYFNVMHKALDMYLSVAILRVPQGLDCSQVLGSQDGWKTVSDVPRTLQPNESSGDLQAVDSSVRNGLSGSIDSLSRNVSQGKGEESTWNEIGYMIFFLINLYLSIIFRMSLFTPLKSHHPTQLHLLHHNCNHVEDRNRNQLVHSEQNSLKIVKCE